MSKIVNRAEMAGVFAVSLPTVDRWVSKGCPVVSRGGKGKEWSFDLAAVIAWRVDTAVQDAVAVDPRKASDEELRRRKLLAEVELVEIESAKAKGEVIDLKTVMHNLGNLLEIVKANMRRVPERVVASVVGNTNEREIKALILAEIDQALTETAEMDFAAEPAPDDEEEHA